MPYISIFLWHFGHLALVFLAILSLYPQLLSWQTSIFAVFSLYRQHPLAAIRTQMIRQVLMSKLPLSIGNLLDNLFCVTSDFRNKDIFLQAPSEIANSFFSQSAVNSGSSILRHKPQQLTSLGSHSDILILFLH